VRRFFSCSPSRLWECGQPAGLSKRRVSDAAFPQPLGRRRLDFMGAAVVGWEDRLVRKVARAPEAEGGALGTEPRRRDCHSGLATVDPFGETGPVPGGRVRLPRYAWGPCQAQPPWDRGRRACRLRRDRRASTAIDRRRWV